MSRKEAVHWSDYLSDGDQIGRRTLEAAWEPPDFISTSMSRQCTNTFSDAIDEHSGYLLSDIEEWRSGRSISRATDLSQPPLFSCSDDLTSCELPDSSCSLSSQSRPQPIPRTPTFPGAYAYSDFPSSLESFYTANEDLDLLELDYYIPDECQHSRQCEVPLANSASPDKVDPERRQPAPSLSKVDWEVHFETIYSMFLVSDQNEILSFLKRKFNFTASSKQYKTIISQWQKDGRLPPKHIKNSDMKAMVRKAQERIAGEGKQSSFFLRGFPVEKERIERFKKRFGFDIDDAEKPAVLPPHIKCRTPPESNEASPRIDPVSACVFPGCQSVANQALALEGDPISLQPLEASSDAPTSPCWNLGAQIEAPCPTYDPIYAVETKRLQDAPLSFSHASLSLISISSPLSSNTDAGDTPVSSRHTVAGNLVISSTVPAGASARLSTRESAVSRRRSQANADSEHPRKRLPHQAVERKYKEILDQLDTLRQLVPEIETSAAIPNSDAEDHPTLGKSSRAAILSSAVSCIKQLQKEKQQLLNEVAFLRSWVNSSQTRVKCEDCPLMQAVMNFENGRAGPVAP